MVLSGKSIKMHKAEEKPTALPQPPVTIAMERVGGESVLFSSLQILFLKYYLHLCVTPRKPLFSECPLGDRRLQATTFLNLPLVAAQTAVRWDMKGSWGTAWETTEIIPTAKYVQWAFLDSNETRFHIKH